MNENSLKLLKISSKSDSFRIVGAMESTLELKLQFIQEINFLIIRSTSASFFWQYVMQIINK